jgi:hypothetical protein
VPAPTAAKIVIPPTSGGGTTGRKVLIGVIILLAIGVIAAIGVSLMGGGEETPQPTATPSPSPTATLIPRSSVTSLFTGTSSTVTLATEGSERDDFINGIAVSQPPAGQVVKLEVRGRDGALSASEFFTLMYGTDAPADVTRSIGEDWSSMVFGQTESAEADGTMMPSDTPSNRLLLVFEVTDATLVNQAMPAWEIDGLATSSAALFGFDMSKQLVSSFSDGRYLDVPVRYWNFPYADRALDWALALAPNGKNYLILGGSKQSMFYAMDRLVK